VANNSGRIAYVNGNVSVSNASANVDFMYNTFQGTLGGNLVLGNEADNGSITGNVFDLSGSYATVEAWEDTIVVNMNNLNAGGNVKNGDTNPLDAENNWWGDNNPADQVTGSVDYDPWEASAYPEY